LKLRERVEPKGTNSPKRDRFIIPDRGEQRREKEKNRPVSRNGSKKGGVGVRSEVFSRIMLNAKKGKKESDTTLEKVGTADLDCMINDLGRERGETKHLANHLSAYRTNRGGEVGRFKRVGVGWRGSRRRNRHSKERGGSVYADQKYWNRGVSQKMEKLPAILASD